MKKFDTVIFDFDGTLVDGLDAIAECFGLTFKYFKFVPPSREDLRHKIGLPLIDIIRDFLAGKSRLNPDELLEVYRFHAKKILPGRTFFRQGIPETLKLLHNNGIKMGIATTKGTATTEKTLENLGVKDMFDAVCGIDLISSPKPNPEQLLVVAAKLSSEPQRTVMVGDTYVDIEAAKAAGMFSIAILDGFGEKEKIINSKPDIIVEDISDLSDILARLFGFNVDNKPLME